MIKIEPEPAADLVWYWGELLGSCPFWIFNPRIINLNGIQTPISNSACSAIYLFSLLEEKIKTGCDLKRVESKIIRDSKHPDWIWVLSELTFCFIPSCQCLVFTYASTWRVAHSPACSQLLQADAEICVSRHTVVSSLLASLFHHPSDRRMAAASKRFGDVNELELITAWPIHQSEVIMSSLNASVGFRHFHRRRVFCGVPDCKVQWGGCKVWLRHTRQAVKIQTRRIQRFSVPERAAPSLISHSFHTADACRKKKLYGKCDSGKSGTNLNEIYVLFSLCSGWKVSEGFFFF